MMHKLLFAVVLLMLAIWSTHAHAAATTCSSAGGTLTLPAVTLPHNPAVGTLLGTPGTVTVTFTCNNLPYAEPQGPDYYADTATIQAGNLAPADASDDPNANNGIRFATNLPGIALKLTASPVQANDRAWIRGGPGSTRGFEPGAITVDSSGWKCLRPGWFSCREYGGTLGGSVSETFTAQLVVTGSVSAGTVNAINLMQFNWYIYGISPSQGYFASLNSTAIKVYPPACSIAVDPTVVTLPTVTTSQFTGSNHPGTTPFNVQLNCPSSASGRSIAITLDSNEKIPGDHGVIAPSQGVGYAKGVGVQILDGNGNTIDFGTAVHAGNVHAGTFNIPLEARYYKTGTPLIGGLVKATATYTITYP